jgi:protein-disulfide isomerase
MDERGVTRRRALAAGVGAGVTALAGCLGFGGDGGALADHPAASGVGAQPRRGPPVGEATTTLVGFEDPSCSRCAAFHRDTVPRILSDLVEPGTATYVVRPYPVVYAWGEPATRALWATYERDAESFWGLLDHYFAEQGAFGSGNVVERTRAWLERETDVDAGAVVEAASAEGFPDPVRENLDVGERAEVVETPTLFMFRDGEYRTEASGSVSYDLVTSALNL